MKKLCMFLAAICMSAAPALSQPIFPNSVVSNDLEFIMTRDASAFTCIRYQGKARQEMPDKRGGDLFANGVHTFEARYADGTAVGVWVHPRVGSESKAGTYAERVAQAVGKLPTVMRSVLHHVVIHEGDETAFGESEGHFFVLYSRNIDTRLRNHDLEETVFHESVHATLDSTYLSDPAWQRAQRRDGGFVTEYAQNNPGKEDMAESALFAWAMLQHPGRLPSNVERQARQIMPNRLGFFKDVLMSKPTFYKVGNVGGC